MWYVRLTIHKKYTDTLGVLWVCVALGLAAGVGVRCDRCAVAYRVGAEAAPPAPLCASSVLLPPYGAHGHGASGRLMGGAQTPEP